MAQGWIAVYRTVMESWIYDDGEPFDRMHAWLDLLLLANHEDCKFMSDGELYVAKRGEVHRSIKWLADRWHWSQGKVHRFLANLERDQMITMDAKRRSRRTTITIVNYTKYQGARQADGEETENWRGSDGELTENWRGYSTMYNNVTTMDNKERGVKRPRFSPPSVEEVRAYCEEHDYAVDPERFVDFYQSKGWMVGKSKMKDWEAAVRSWASRHEKEDRHVTNDDWSFMDL